MAGSKEGHLRPGRRLPATVCSWAVLLRLGRPCARAGSRGSPLDRGHGQPTSPLLSMTQPGLSPSALRHAQHAARRPCSNSPRSTRRDQEPQRMRSRGPQRLGSRSQKRKAEQAGHEELESSLSCRRAPFAEACGLEARSQQAWTYLPCDVSRSALHTVQQQQQQHDFCLSVLGRRCNCLEFDW